MPKSGLWTLYTWPHLFVVPGRDDGPRTDGIEVIPVAEHERAMGKRGALMPNLARSRSVYVAGGTKDVERVQSVQALVRDQGWQITFDWTGAEGEIRTDGSWDTVPDVGARIASREITACVEADLVIVLCPPAGLGCWIEVGAALAGGADVWVVEPHRDSVFWQHPAVRRLTLAGLREELANPPEEDH